MNTNCPTLHVAPNMAKNTYNHGPRHLGPLRPLDGPLWINGPDAPCSLPHKAYSHLIRSALVTRNLMGFFSTSWPCQPTKVAHFS
jgi:hypothetical protein